MQNFDAMDANFKIQSRRHPAHFEDFALDGGVRYNPS